MDGLGVIRGYVIDGLIFKNYILGLHISEAENSQINQKKNEYMNECLDITRDPCDPA